MKATTPEELREAVARDVFGAFRLGYLAAGKSDYPEWEFLSEKVRDGWRNHPRTNDVLRAVVEKLGITEEMIDDVRIDAGFANGMVTTASPAADALSCLLEAAAGGET